MIIGCREVVSVGEGGSGPFSAPLDYPLQLSRNGSRPGSQAGSFREVESNTPPRCYLVIHRRAFGKKIHRPTVIPTADWP